jgi:hypothetical protein
MARKDTIVDIALAESSAAIAKASKEDSAVTGTIAIESKRDSLAMKAIVILDVFLPGTFIAVSIASSFFAKYADAHFRQAIFAMLAYDWDDYGVSVVESGFKYYWAVTISLTAAVLLFWGLAMLLPWRAWVARPLKSPKRDRNEIGLA